MITLAELVATPLFGSVVVAAVVSGAFNLWFRRQDEEKKRFEKFYGPLLFHLLSIDAIDKNIARVINAGNKAHKDLKFYKIEGNRYIELSNEIFRSEAVTRTLLIKKWWFEIDEIAKLLKENPDKIKKEDLSLTKMFLDKYISREYLGKATFTRMPLALRMQLQKEEEALPEVINEFKRKFL